MTEQDIRADERKRCGELIMKIVRKFKELQKPDGFDKIDMYNDGGYSAAMQIYKLITGENVSDND